MPNGVMTAPYNSLLYAPLPRGRRIMASHSHTVLVVEQEAALRAVVAQALATDGYRVLATGNGKGALRMAARHDDEVALVVTDMIVPGFDEGHLPELLSLDSPQIKVLYLDPDLPAEPILSGTCTRWRGTPRSHPVARTGLGSGPGFCGPRCLAHCRR